MSTLFAALRRNGHRLVETYDAFICVGCMRHVEVGSNEGIGFMLEGDLVLLCPLCAEQALHEPRAALIEARQLIADLTHALVPLPGKRVAALRGRGRAFLATTEVVECPRCQNGAGRTDPFPCPQCNASGFVIRSKE